MAYARKQQQQYFGHMSKLQLHQQRLWHTIEQQQQQQQHFWHMSKLLLQQQHLQLLLLQH